MMPLMYIVLLVALGFAVIVGALLLGYFYCTKPEEDDGGGENEGFLQNNNNVQVQQRSSSVLETRHPSIRSRPSAPILTELNELVPNGISRANSRQSVNSHRVDEMRAIQSSWLRNNILRSTNAGESEVNLIIGVDAQPSVFGGYCVRLEQEAENNWVEFYSILREDLPWRLGENVDESEVEAKNFLFALMLWHDAILEARRILIYTGNQAQASDNNKYGRRATKLMEHYSQCEGIVFGNDYRYIVNPQKEPKSYAEYVLPAQDLSSGNLREFHQFVSEYYEVGLDNFRGTHYIPPFDKGKSTMSLSSQTLALYPKLRNESEVGFEKLENYDRYIEKVRNAMNYWIQPCPKCGYVDDETAASMHSINRIPA